MAYSEDYRKRVMEYLDEGKTWEEARSVFKISMSAICSWRKIYKETGEVKDKPRRKKDCKKLNPDALRRYVEEHPDAYLREIGEAFDCNESAVRKAFKRLGITRKKRQSGIVSKKRNK